MRLKQLFASFALSLVMVSSAASQSPDSQDSAKKDQQQQKAQEEREKKALALLDETIKEAQSLRAPENRIRIQIGIADLLWSRDEKRARAIFKEAIAGYDEISRKAHSNTPRPDGINIREDVSRFQSASNPYVLRMMSAMLRQEILQALIAHDAKWAREFLRASRQSATSGEEANNYSVDMDLALDMQLAKQVAETEPKQALEIAQENFEGAFSAGQAEGFIGIIQGLQGKDQEAASKLANSVMKKLRAQDLSSKPGLANFALNFLMAVTRRDKQDATDKQAASNNADRLLDEQSLRDLVEMLVTAALKEDASSEEDEDSNQVLNLMAIQSVMPLVEKYAPTRAAAVRAKITEFNKSLDPQTKAWTEFASKGIEPTAEDMLNAAAKLPAENREELYAQAIQIAIAKGELDRARQIAKENIKNEGARNALLASIDRQTLMSATTQGKLEDARQMLARVESVEERAVILSQLAMATAAKGDKKSALQLITEARGLVGYEPESAAQFVARIEIAGAAVKIDPAQSFELLEGMIEPINFLVGASAAIDTFEGRHQFKEGEMIVRGTGLISNMLQSWSKNLKELAREDMDRAKIDCDRFQRVEVRLMTRLSVIRGVLSNGADAIDTIEKRFTRSFMNQAIID